MEWKMLARVDVVVAFWTFRHSFKSSMESIGNKKATLINFRIQRKFEKVCYIN